MWRMKLSWGFQACWIQISHFFHDVMNHFRDIRRAMVIWYRFQWDLLWNCPQFWITLSRTPFNEDKFPWSLGVWIKWLTLYLEKPSVLTFWLSQNLCLHFLHTWETLIFSFPKTRLGPQLMETCVSNVMWSFYLILLSSVWPLSALKIDISTDHWHLGACHQYGYL